MKKVSPDYTLFAHSGTQGTPFVPYVQHIEGVQRRATLAVLEAKIAAHGKEIHSELSRIHYYEDPDYLPFKSVEAYINKMRVRVPMIDPHPTYEPITEEAVKEILSLYGFVADNIAVKIEKKKRRFKYVYDYYLTFAAQVAHEEAVVE